VSSLNLVLLLGAFLVLSAFFSAGEAALFGLPRLRLRRLARHGAGSGLFRQVLETPHRVLVGILLGNTLANVAATALAALLLHHWAGDRLTLGGLVAVQVLATSFVLLVLCELAPKTYALEHGERFALRLAPPLRLAGSLLKPFVRLLEALSRGTARLFRGPPAGSAAVEDLRTLIEEGERRGSLTPEEGRLFAGAFRLRVRTAADVMTPCADLVAAPAAARVSEVIELANLARHSRIPVYDGALGRIVGVVEARDLLPFRLGEGEDRTAREAARPPFFVPADLPVEVLLRQMQRERVRLVVVGGEGREALGIVTIEDILEEVVGDIRGELEEEEPAVRLLDDGSALVRGDVRVSDVNRLIGTALASGDGETVEGLVRRLWAQPPSEGEEKTAAGGDVLGIESLVGARVWSVRVRRGRPGGSVPDGSAPGGAGERAA
jgi:CBS domain containing-hemolysin-like protein